MYKPGGYFIRNPDLVPVYLHPGMWGWVLHRITGLLIVFYLLLHIWVIGRAAVSPQSVDAIMETLSGPFWRVLGVGLLACVLYHGINGVRIILFDLGGMAFARTGPSGMPVL
jgi:succinate dehydrogenase / fumarate reductase cytochrome b subunit